MNNSHALRQLAVLAAAVSLFSPAPAQTRAAPSSAPLPSFVLFDNVVTHRGAHQLYQNWDFETRQKTSPGAPTDWLQGGDRSFFNAGIYHLRVEVRRMERAWDSPMTVQFGWWNIEKDPEIRHIASPPLPLSHLIPPLPGQPWVYELIGTVRALDKISMYYGKGPRADQQVVDWDWSRAVAPGTFYTLIRPVKNKLDLDGDGKISEAEYPDIEFRIVLTIHGPASPAYEFLRERIKGFTSPAVSFTANPALR